MANKTFSEVQDYLKGKVILVANRGIPARRICRSIRERFDAVAAMTATDVDKTAPAASTAQELMLLGSDPRAYLDIDRIIDKAKQRGVVGIHPGWGFASEDTRFPQRCKEAGITFIGATAEAMNLLGNKVQAREVARKLGIPVVPGSEGAVDIPTARKLISEIGLPIMLKAEGGGGGRGIFAIHNEADLEDAFKKGLFTLDQFIEYYTNSYDHSKVVPHRSPEYFSDERIQELSALRGADHTPENDSAAFKKWLTQTRQWLMYVAIYRFSCKYKEIMAGTYCGDLFEGTNHAITIDILKGAMRKFAFDTPGILKLELSGQVILDFLLDHFVPAVLYYDSAYCTDGQAPSKADKKLLAIFSGNYKQDYQNTRTGTESFDLYLRLLMVTDYISGMTDSYARTLYRELSGIE